ncbi:MAG TPA: hypothetical protein VFE06_10370 [Acidobacteriaceae bacterium]|jgi:hypothetical protein|nr:hypothetical protein [Acidobacteriaceae bacterium]
MHEESRPEGGFFFFSLYKFRIPSSDGSTARIWACHGYELSVDWKGIVRRTVLWSGRKGLDKISTENGKNAHSPRYGVPGAEAGFAIGFFFHGLKAMAFSVVLRYGTAARRSGSPSFFCGLAA